MVQNNSVSGRLLFFFVPIGIETRNKWLQRAAHTRRPFFHIARKVYPKGVVYIVGVEKTPPAHLIPTTYRTRESDRRKEQ